MLGEFWPLWTSLQEGWLTSLAEGVLKLSFLSTWSCLVGLSTRILALQVEPPATVTCVSGISRPLGQEWFVSSSNSIGILLSEPIAARHETITDCPRGITMSRFLDFTITALLERGGTLFDSTKLADMVRRIHSGYTMSHWRSLCPFPHARLHPLAKWSVEPHLKQWSQLSTPAVLHELHCRRRKCDWLPDT